MSETHLIYIHTYHCMYCILVRTFYYLFVPVMAFPLVWLLVSTLLCTLPVVQISRLTLYTTTPLQIIQDLNAVKRLVRDAKIDYYSLYKLVS